MEQYIAKVTEILREADQLFQTTGGSTRHYVRDLLLPMFEQAGLKIVDAAPSPAKPSVNGELLGFLEIEIEKANKNGKDCNLKDGDLNRAQAWYSAAEAFSIVKNKITELLNTPHGHESNIINCPSCNAVWNLSRHNSCQCGATLVTKASPAKAEQEGPKPISSYLREYSQLKEYEKLLGGGMRPEYTLEQVKAMGWQEVLHMLTGYVDILNLMDGIIYVLEKGAGEWETEAGDWKWKFEAVFAALKELTALKAIKEKDGETVDYLARKPKAWATAKELTSGYKIEKREQEGPWKYEVHHDLGPEDTDEWVTITDGKVILHFDQQEDEVGEQRVVNLLNTLKAKIWYENPDAHVAGYLQEQVKLMTTELEQLRQWKKEAIQLMDPIYQWGWKSKTLKAGTDIFKAVLDYATKYERCKEQEGLRWVNSCDRLPGEDGAVCLEINGGYMTAYVRSKDELRWIADSGGHTIRNWKQTKWLESTTPPVKEAGQPRNLPIEELIKLSDEELNVEINKVRSRLGMGKSEEARQPADDKTFDENLAYELIARFVANSGKKDSIKKIRKEAFVDGALWAKKYLESPQQPAGDPHAPDLSVKCSTTGEPVETCRCGSDHK